MTRIILSILRQAAEPLPTRDIALQLLTERALDKQDQRLLRLMTRRVGGEPYGGNAEASYGPRKGQGSTSYGKYPGKN